VARAEPDLPDPVLEPSAGPALEADGNGQPPASEEPAGKAQSLPPEAEPPAEAEEPVAPPPEDPPVPVASVAVLPAPLASPVVFANLPPPPQAALAPLETRIRRLEEALAHLQEVQARAGHPVPPAFLIQPPPAQNSAPSTGAMLLDVGKRLFRSSAESPPPAAEAGRPRQGRRWLLGEIVAEARVILRMFLDPRYKLTFFGRVVPLLLVAAIVLSYWWVPGTSIFIVGTLLDKVVDLVLAFVLFKVLGHEARRYRETSPDLPPHLRL
jgi:hypothetical protein